MEVVALGLAANALPLAPAGWSKALPRSAVAAAAGDGGGGGAASDAEAAEMHALSRVGHRKQV